MTRLIPFIPFNALNYALGLTRIRLVSYALASFVFMAPGAAAYAYLGHAGRSLATGDGDLVQNVLPRPRRAWPDRLHAPAHQALRQGPEVATGGGAARIGYSRRSATRIGRKHRHRAYLVRRAERHRHEGEQGGDPERELTEHCRRRYMERRPAPAWTPTTAVRRPRAGPRPER